LARLAGEDPASLNSSSLTVVSFYSRPLQKTLLARLAGEDPASINSRIFGQIKTYSYYCTYVEERTTSPTAISHYSRPLQKTLLARLAGEDPASLNSRIFGQIQPYSYYCTYLEERTTSPTVVSHYSRSLQKTLLARLAGEDPASLHDEYAER